MRLWFDLYLHCDTAKRDAVRCRTLREAVARFRQLASVYDAWECAPPQGLIHLSCQGEIVAEPDYVLSVGPRGGIRCERA